MLIYPSSLPSYNKFRVRPIDTTGSDEVCVSITLPKALSPLAVGLVSLLGETEIWNSNDEDERQAMVDYFNNNTEIAYDCGSGGDVKRIFENSCVIYAEYDDGTIEQIADILACAANLNDSQVTVNLTDPPAPVEGEDQPPVEPPTGEVIEPVKPEVCSNEGICAGAEAVVNYIAENTLSLIQEFAGVVGGAAAIVDSYFPAASKKVKNAFAVGRLQEAIDAVLTVGELVLSADISDPDNIDAAICALYCAIQTRPFCQYDDMALDEARAAWRDIGVGWSFVADMTANGFLATIGAGFKFIGLGGIISRRRTATEFLIGSRDESIACSLCTTCPANAWTITAMRDSKQFKKAFTYGNVQVFPDFDTPSQRFFACGEREPLFIQGGQPRGYVRGSLRVQFGATVQLDTVTFAVRRDSKVAFNGATAAFKIFKEDGDETKTVTLGSEQVVTFTGVGLVSELFIAWEQFVFNTNGVSPPSLTPPFYLRKFTLSGVGLEPDITEPV